MKLKRILASSLALTMACGLAACTTTTTTGSSSAAAPAESSSAPAAQSSSAATSSDAAATTDTHAPAEITWWAFPTFGVDSGYEQEVITAFNAVHPEISVKLVTIDFQSGPEALASAIEAGTAPDVLFDAPGRIIEYGRNGKLVKLDDMFDDAFTGDVANKDLLKACKADDTAYMYPLSVAPFYMGLNKEALEKADALQYVNMEGDRAWTTDNFIKMCEALRDKAPTQVPGIVYCGGQGGDQGTRALVNNLYGSSIVGADGKWTIDDKGIKALTQLQTMVSGKSLASDSAYVAADELQAFQNGTTAMTFCWGTSSAITYKADNYTQISVPFPSDDGKPSLEFLANGFCVFDNKDDAKAEAAKAFIKFICDDPTWGPKSVVKSGAFPVRSSFGDLYPGDAEKALLASWTQYYGPYYNTLPNFAAMRTEWWNMLQRIFQGGDVATEVGVFNTQANQAPAA